MSTSPLAVVIETLACRGPDGGDGPKVTVASTDSLLGSCGGGWVGSGAPKARGLAGLYRTVPSLTVRYGALVLVVSLSTSFPVIWNVWMAGLSDETIPKAVTVGVAWMSP